MRNYLKWSLVLFLWIYIIWRAYSVPITHDEAYSFLLIKTNYINALAGTANTHWINSIGMKLGSLFSYHPFALRIFSLFAWLLYGYSAIKISCRVKNHIASIVLLVALTLNPFLLDFFSLARGYSLACAFSLASIWQIIVLLDNKNWHPVQWIPAIGLASIGVMANYTTLYLFLSIVGVYVASLLLHKKWQLFGLFFKSRLFWIVAGTCIIAISNLFFIKLYTGDLEFGGHSGFVNSIFGSLVSGSMYYLWSDQTVNIVTFFITALVGITFITCFLKYIRTKVVTPFVFLSACLFVILLLNIFFHVAFKTPYLLSRTTLILYPCIVVVVFYFFKSLAFSIQWKKYLEMGLGMPLLILFAIHFAHSFNTIYCFEWKDQADTKECLELLVKEKAKHVLVHRWHTGVLANYYKTIAPAKYNFSHQLFVSNQLTMLLQQNDTATLKYDYAILLPPYNLQALQEKHIPFTVLKHFPVSDAVVLKLRSLNESQ